MGPRVYLRDQTYASLWRGAFKDDLWKYLQEKYTVRAETQRQTQFLLHPPAPPIHRNRKFTFAQLKAIAQAVIYFEPAFSRLLTPQFHRRSNFSGTNWRTLVRSIQCAANELQLVELMHPPLNPHLGPVPHRIGDAGYGDLDSNLTWNFITVQPLCRGEGAVEFRNPGPCVGADEILGWAELALSFVHAALQNPGALEQFANDIEGLWAFMEKFFIPGMNEPARMASFFTRARRRSG